jgi:predicted nucleic acid-binding protein
VIDRVLSSALVPTESLRTLDRLRRKVKLTDAEIAERRAKLLELIASLEIVDIDSVVLDRAAQPMPTELGTLDAIHLATALLWKEMTGEDPTMATHDNALAIAAEAHGLRVVGAKRK